MGTRTAIAALGIFTIALLTAGCGGDIRADELSRSIDTVVSSAREGALIAEGVAQDRTKTTFVRVRARELTEETDHEAEKLNDATADPELAAEKKAAVALASQTSDVLGELQVSPSDEATALEVMHRLRRLADRAEKLQGSL
jgi:hypothetical protein